MRLAIIELTEVGADQTLGAAQDHTQFMANVSVLAQFGTKVREALVASSALAGHKQTAVIEAFLQRPFTGTYAAHSGEVVGILKDMRDTFKANLAQATADEEAAIDAHTEFMRVMLGNHNTMGSKLTRKQQKLSSNDQSLDTKRQQLQAAQADKSGAQSFLGTLLDMCSAK